MNNIYDISPSAKRIQEASEWVVKLDRGLKGNEESDLHLWLGKSELNALALMKVGQTWDKANVLAKLADLFPEEESPRRHSWAMPAIAASVALVGLTLWFALYQPEPSQVEFGAELAQVEQNIEGLYKTAVGESISVNLPDGTELLLNTNTTVRVNYSDKQRLLTLEQGELHVDVAHDIERPLSVLAAGQVIQAVGTAFNVELGADRKVDLVVTEGKVLVEERNALVPAEIDRDLLVMPLSSVAVSEGERLVIGELDESIQPIEAAEIEAQLSWQEGNLVFRGEPLEEAILEISRYTSVEFVFSTEDLKQRKVAGLFQAGDIDGLLVALNDNFDIEYQRIDQQVILSSIQ